MEGNLKFTNGPSQEQAVNGDVNPREADAIIPALPSFNQCNRRTFLSRVAGGTAATITLSALGLPLPGLQSGVVKAGEIGPATGVARRNQSAHIRHSTEIFNKHIPIPNHPDNGDEALYPDRIGNYSKGLRHNVIGEVEPSAYNALLAAIASGRHADFEALVAQGHFGCPDPARQRRLVNPQAAYAFDLEGTDSHQLAMRPAPAFSSAEEAGEMAELYWMALARDINFQAYATHPITQAAAEDLSRFSDFRGPKKDGRVTPHTLFRDSNPGCTVGPYLSQFLLKTADFGAQRVDQRFRTLVHDKEYMTDFQSWLAVQNGYQPAHVNEFDTELRFCRNGRDMCQYVHVDALYQAYFVACLILLANGLPLDAGNPYGPIPDPGSGRPLPLGASGSLAQVGFGTFGGPHILALLTEVSTRALKAIWYQKWLVHRRLRPEEFGGRVEVNRLGLATYPIHPELLNSPVLDRIFSRTGNYLLPIAFPEGSPLHTSYGSGHATVAGACVTILKAWFEESAVIPNPVVPSRDGLRLEPYTGPPLTVGGELNKLMSNISQARNIAGVHWRTDATEANKLGEAIAISVLRDQRATYSEDFAGFTLTKLDGTTITI